MDGTKMEFILEETHFKEIDYETGQKAIAVNIRTLLLTLPGSDPKDPEFGIGIQRFTHELDDGHILNSIKTLLETNLTRYLPDVNVMHTEVKPMTKLDGTDNFKKSIAILIAVAPPEGIDTMEDVQYFTYRVGTNTKGRVISEVIV